MFIKLIDVTSVGPWHWQVVLAPTFINRDRDGANRGRDCRVNFVPTLNYTIVIREGVF